MQWHAGGADADDEPYPEERNHHQAHFDRPLGPVIGEDPSIQEEDGDAREGQAGSVEEHAVPAGSLECGQGGELDLPGVAARPAECLFDLAGGYSGGADQSG